MSDSIIFGSLYNDPQIGSIFSDEHWVGDLLLVETALANVQARLGIIPKEAAETIISQAGSFQVDFDQLREGTEKAGFPVIGFLAQFRRHVGGSAAEYIHWGATTQDIMDTATVLQARSALQQIERNLKQVLDNFAGLANKHRKTIMAGRTHSQQALPITFGYKVAGWMAPLIRHRERLNEIKPRFLMLQFGGATGTLAALGERGIDVQRQLAVELGLNLPIMPWHTQRDSFGEIGSWLSLLTGSLGKIAQDVILLAQSEVGEIRESGDPSRGGSSTMPQKSNPVISEYILAAARTNAVLLTAVHQAQIQEHERATHGWQLEMLNLPQMFVLTGGAVKNMLFLSENLVVDAEKMRNHVLHSQGLILAEAISFALAETMGRTQAKKVVSEACKTALEKGIHLVDAVREKTAADLDWDALRDPVNYLGASEAFIDNVLKQLNADSH